jgi:nucleotide-binding universal stress UspA family protein
MYTRLLVPLDGTPESEAALPPARTLAATLGSQVIEIRVIERPAETIISEAAARGADLIVMASHEPTGLERLVAGSVAENVLRHSRLPVLLVRPGEQRMQHVKLILVPVDGSPESLLGLSTAARLAQTAHAVVVLLRVVVPLPLWIYDPTLGLNTGPLIDPRWDEDRRENAEAYVRQLARQVANSGIEAGADAVLGEVAPTIAEFADQQFVDLIVMGIRARRIPLGSVATEVVRSAHQPVLLINRSAARPTERAAYAGVPTVTVSTPHGQVHDDDRYAVNHDR